MRTLLLVALLAMVGCGTSSVSEKEVHAYLSSTISSYYPGTFELSDVKFDNSTTDKNGDMNIYYSATLKMLKKGPNLTFSEFLACQGKLGGAYHDQYPTGKAQDMKPGESCRIASVLNAEKGSKGWIISGN